MTKYEKRGEQKFAIYQKAEEMLSANPERLIVWAADSAIKVKQQERALRRLAGILTTATRTFTGKARADHIKGLIKAAMEG